MIDRQNCSRMPRRHGLSFIAACLLMLIGFTGTAQAESYQVNASVPYDPPTEAAVIRPELDGAIANDALVTISGTCQAMATPTIVSIWRSGAAIGSAPCNGSFSIQIMLTPGENNLIARTSNLSGQYGPNSASITIRLVLPAPAVSNKPASTSSIEAEPPTGLERAKATNEAARDNLIITAPTPFSVLSDNNSAKIWLNISGGTAPYTVNLNWGNGATESHALDAPGDYSYIGGYDKAGTYLMRGRVRDSKGAYAEFSYAIVSNIKADKASMASAPATGTGFNMRPTSPVIITTAAITSLVGLATFAGFRMGELEIVNSLRQRSLKVKVPRQRAASRMTKPRGRK